MASCRVVRQTRASRASQLRTNYSTVNCEVFKKKERKKEQKRVGVRMTVMWIGLINEVVWVIRWGLFRGFSMIGRRSLGEGVRWRKLWQLL